MISLRDAAQKARLARRATGAALSTATHYGRLNVDQARYPKSKHDDLLYKWTNRWGHSVMSLFNVKATTEGRHVENGEVYPRWAGRGGVGRMFVANHRSGFDIPTVLALTESRMVSRHDLAEWPYIGSAAKRGGTLFVDRSSRQSGATVLKEMCAALNAGHGIAIFPEGTAHPGDEVRTFHMGAFNAAARTGAEIVPIGIAYGDERAYYGDESFGQHLARAGSLPEITVGISIGEGFYADGAEGELKRLKDFAQGEVQKLVHAARALIGPVRKA